jgi:arylsulfatase A-like enzyme
MESRESRQSRESASVIDRQRIWLWVGVVLHALACAPETAAPPPDVFVIVLDTTRADHLSVYGYPRNTTPNLERLAADAVLFERAYSTSCWTIPAHASLFTGLRPIDHGATQEHTSLSDDSETLAQLATRAGYHTAAFSGNPWVSEATQLSRGFEHVSPRWLLDAKELPEGGLPHPTNRAVFEWLDGREDERPRFVFVNFIEPHWPYSAPRRFQDHFLAAGVSDEIRKRSDFPAAYWYLRRDRYSRELVKLRIARYDAELAFADAAVGELLDGLAERGLRDTSWIVVTGDHGENFGANGHMGHSFNLRNSSLRVPLLIRDPGASGAGTVRRDPVSLVDVFATLTSAMGIVPGDPRVAGRDLWEGPLPEDRAVLAEYYYPKSFLGRFPRRRSRDAVLDPYRRRIRSVQVGSYKLVRGSDGVRDLYDLAVDPAELHDVSGRDPARVAALDAVLDAALKVDATDELDPLELMGEAVDPPDEPEPAVLDGLRSLGYIE